MEGLTLRFAAPSEAEQITALARRSKAYWGYGPEVLDRMREMLMISAEQIRTGHVVVADRHGVLLGYYQLGGVPPHGELMDMFVDPALIGTGLGRTLWNHAIRSARERGFHRLALESDPHAEPFYLRMGARRVGEREVAHGRRLPLMEAILADMS